MTIAQTTPRVPFLCNGTTTVFPVSLQSYLAGDFLVVHTTAAGASTQLVLGTDFTLAPVGSDEPPQWELTTTLTYPAGDYLQVIDSPTVQQQTVYNPGQAFPSAAVQQNMDRMTQMIQRIYDLVARSISAPDGDISPQMALPSAQARANTNLGFGPQGQLALNAALLTATLSGASIGNFLWPVLGVEGASVVAGQYIYGDYRRYGVSTANADNAAFVRSALATTLNIIHADENYLVASPIVQTVAGQQFAWYGTFTAAQNWTSAAQTPTNYNNIVDETGVSRNSGGTVNNFVFSHNGTGSIINNYSPLLIDGGINAGTGLCMADCYQAEGQSSGGQTRLLGNPTVVHAPNACYAITCAYQGDIVILGANGAQWNGSDPLWGTQSSYTSFGIYANRPDSYISTGIMRYNHINYGFGNYSGTTGLVNVHDYNGTFGGPPAQVDPINLWVAEGSSGCWARGIYLDNGHADIHSSDFQLEVVLPLQTGSRCIFSQDAGQVTPNMIRMYATNKGVPYDTHIQFINKYQAASNSGSGNSLPTSPLGFYPAPPINLLTLTSNGTTATATYNATSQFGPQANLALFIAGATTSAFDNSVAAGSFVNGKLYQITAIGTTDFTQCGAAINAVGHIFVANGVGAGTGTASQAYLVATGAIAAGIVTVTFPCTVNATASVPGTIQRSFNANMNGLDVVSAGVFGASANEVGDVAAAFRRISTSSSLVADELVGNQPLVRYRMRSGNYSPSEIQHGNQQGGYPYLNLISGYVAVIAANYPGSPYPAARFGLNANGTFIQDDGFGNFNVYTNGALRMTIYNNGGIVVGAATGGNQGAGTINFSGGLYVNGTAVTVP